jgi:hypothetical protein
MIRAARIPPAPVGRQAPPTRAAAPAAKALRAARGSHLSTTGTASTAVDVGEVLNLLGIWRGASFAGVRVIHQTGFGEPGKGAPHGDETTCFAAHP